MKLTLSFAKLLKSSLVTQLNFAEFKGANRIQLQRFVDDGILEIKAISPQRKKIYCPNQKNLQNYLANKFEIPSLEEYISYLEQSEFSRSQSVFVSSDSKLRKTHVFKGLFVNTIHAMECYLDGEPFILTGSRGAFNFIADYKKFIIPRNVTVVIVEGYENFRYASSQLHLFGSLTPIFIWRYQNSNTIVEWLNIIQNDYIHFGDFDPKGVHIYLSEFKAKIFGMRGNFLIPENIEFLISTFGSRELYETQKRFMPDDSLVQEAGLKNLLRLLNQYKKGLAQEIMLTQK